MKNSRRFSGFTLAEVLIVVAITVVLAGVGFVSVFNHMRSLAQLERDTIAKEIFVAAQNHLTTAESQGYLSLKSDEYGMPGNFDAKDKSSQGDTVVYYLVIPNGVGNYQKAFDLMLPFGAVDETVRAGGSYIIRYQPAAARVLDVFYCARSGRFALENGFKGTDDYSKLMSDEYYGESKKSARRNYGDTKAVVGWYGGEASVEVGERLAVPTIEIINAERLQVKVTNPNQSASLQLIITGEKSQAKKVITILTDVGSSSGDTRVSTDDDGNYLITLDDITNNTLHFCQLSDDQNTSQGQLIPGENISIRAIAFSNTKLTNVARSQEGKTNSLFGYDKTAKDHSIALISNIRHLENLDTEVSMFTGVGLSSESQSGDGNNVTIQADAKQTTDLVWPDFLQKVSEQGSSTQKPSIHYFISGGTSSTEPETYKPVTPDYTLKYDGNNHSISEVEVDYAGDAGIFGALTDGSVSDLLILDSAISSSGNAGGLIGSMSGTTVERCAANGTVSSSGEDCAAGGLIGEANSGSVTACYSAGHTEDGSYEKWVGTGETGSGNGYDVTGATAGGLIGGAESTAIEFSYSTCSATGTTVGGLIGSGNGAVTSCYATGLVKGTGENPTEGAFAGSFEGNIVYDETSNIVSYYYQIINERQSTDGTISYLPPVGNNTSLTSVKALDETADSYDKFVGSDWKEARPNDTDLKTFYQGFYPLRTVAQLGASLPVAEQGKPDWFINTHYGDWPAPEIFVINSSSNG